MKAHKKRAVSYKTAPRIYGRCPCGKLRYESRSEAKRVSKLMADNMSAFRCGDWWHLGHLPDYVVQGRASRAVLERQC